MGASTIFWKVVDSLIELYRFWILRVSSNDVERQAVGGNWINMLTIASMSANRFIDPLSCPNNFVSKRENASM